MSDTGLYASVDIGTNTVRMLVADVEDSGRLKPVFKKNAIIRLGGGFKPSTGISKDAFLRGINVLASFSESLSSFSLKGLRVVGTSALRRAVNSGDFIARVEELTGLKVEIIPGTEEAALSLKGVMSAVNCGKRYIVMDIGGGSTEYIFSANGVSKGCYSLSMGVVDLAERFLKNDPPLENEIHDMEKGIETTIKELVSKLDNNGINASDYSRSGALLVGTAGTPTTLSAIEQKMGEYDADRINGYVLKYRNTISIYERLKSMPLERRSQMTGLEKGREDVIIPGTAVILKTMDYFGFRELTVSDSGLLEGVILKLREDDRCIERRGLS